MELAVQPRNSLNKSGTIVVVDTSMQGDSNGTNGGDGNGNIISPTATPAISDLWITGNLAVGAAVNGTYKFNANQGDPNDQSSYAWSKAGEGDGNTSTDVLSTTDRVSISGEVPDRTIVRLDAGKLLELSVFPRNGVGKTGAVQTVNSKQSFDAGQASGGNSGVISDPSAIPKISNLQITGTSLAVGANLNATYTFDANNGDVTDKSLYLWDNVSQSQLAGILLNSNNNLGTTVTSPGNVGNRKIESGDVGKIIMVAVLPVNGRDIKGIVKTAKTSGTAGLVLTTVPPNTGDYTSTFKFVKNQDGSDMKGLIWPRLDNGDFAGGKFKFTNAQQFISPTSNGTVSIAVDDQLISLSVNGTSYSFPGKCSFNAGPCNISVPFDTQKGNTIVIEAQNDGSGNSGNPGALNVRIADGNGATILTTERSENWTFSAG
ncbi:Uncharacterised protein [Yersinia intermedia]|nr:Uncharacterised protein [Yersinia intermedia]CNH41835.1 Uncharacterised protein [Yersinia intermedia]